MCQKWVNFVNVKNNDNQFGCIYLKDSASKRFQETGASCWGPDKIAYSRPEVTNIKFKKHN